MYNTLYIVLYMYIYNVHVHVHYTCKWSVLIFNVLCKHVQYYINVQNYYEKVVENPAKVTSARGRPTRHKRARQPAGEASRKQKEEEEEEEDDTMVCLNLPGFTGSEIRRLLNPCAWTVHVHV